MPIVEYTTTIDRRLAGDPVNPYTYQVITHLTANSAIGATTLTVDGWPTALTADTLVAIDPYTAQCEVRRVTAVTGSTATLSSALAYTHAALDTVLVATGGEVNVLWFGALADNTTNDLAAFRAAAADIGTLGGGVLRVPAGTYRLEVGVSAASYYISLPSGCDLRMEGATINAVAASAQTGYYVFSVSGVSNVRITGGSLALDRATGSLSGETGYGIRISNAADNIWISDMVISDSFGDAIYIGGSTACTNVTVRDCRLTNCRRNNMSIVHCKRAWVINCDLDGANGTAPQAGIDLEPNSGNVVEDIVISGCRARDNVGSGFLIQSGAGGRTAGAAATRRITVDGCTALANGYGINMSVVDYCTVTGNLTSGSVTGAGISLAEIVNCTITGNITTGNAASGLYVEGADTCTITGNVSRDNASNGYYLRGQATGGDWGGQYCTIAGNVAQNNGAMGYRCLNLHYSVIGDNQSTFNDEHGFSFDTCNNNRIGGNVSAGDGKATDATYSGLTFTSSDYNAVHGNVVRHSERYFTGTASSGGASAVTLPSGASGYDDWYNGKTVAILSGTGSGQTRTVSDYDGTTRVVTVSLAWDTQPDNSSVVEIRNANRITKSITFSAGSDNNWYIGNDLRIGGAVTDSGTGNVTTAGNLT